MREKVRSKALLVSIASIAASGRSATTWNFSAYCVGLESSMAGVSTVMNRLLPPTITSRVLDLESTSRLGSSRNLKHYNIRAVGI